MRNPGQPRNEDELKIDPGPRTVHAGDPAASFDTGRFRQTPVPLGEMRAEESGRLLVLGGFGKADSDPKGIDLSDNFADNNDWFDDVSDGPVRATVTTADGRTHTAKPSWVIVAPPDFAPGITNFVTMYDVARDVAVQRGGWPSPSDRRSPATSTRSSAGPSPTPGSATGRGVGIGPTGGRPRLQCGRRSPTPTNPRTMRQERFVRLRDPRARPAPIHPNTMPRLHDETGAKGEVLPLTVTQYAILEKWAAGSFIGDWQKEQDSGELIADALDRVALQACSGGAFFPGIEAGRIMTEPEKYSEPYRLDAESLVPGQVTQGNALPWQADFILCADDGLGWWPAQRPDKVYLDVASAEAGAEEDSGRGLKG